MPNGLAFPPLPPFGKLKPPLFEPLPKGEVALLLLSFVCIAELTAAPTPADASTSTTTAMAAMVRRAATGGRDDSGGGPQLAGP